MGLQLPKLPKFLFFGINLPKRGISPYEIFTKFGLRKGVRGPHPYAKFQHCGLKMWAYKLQKMVIFGINLPPRENTGGRQKNLNIGAQLQTFLYAMTPLF